MKRVGQLYRENLVNKIKQGIDKSDSVFLLNCSNLDAGQMSNVRKDLRQVGAQVFFSKNVIAAIALRELKNENLAERIERQTALVWSGTDSVAISKILVKFTVDFKDIKIAGGVLSGRTLEQEDIKKLADLPSREVLLSQLLGTIQAPLNQLASVLNAKLRELLSVLKQLSEKKGGNE